jgi:hypothetical protein
MHGRFSTGSLGITMKALWLIPFIFVSSAWACVEDIPEQYRDLVRGNPVEDAAADQKSGKVGFWAVASDGFYVPETPGSGFCWADANLVRRVKGTTDEICSEEQEEFEDAAWRYAEAYNTEMLRLEPSLSAHRCAKSKRDYE